MTRLFLGGAAACVARAAGGILATALGTDLGWAALRVCAASKRRASGSPERWLVTIGGEPGSSVAFARNSDAISAKPTTAKKVSAGIAGVYLTSKRSYSRMVKLERSMLQKVAPLSWLNGGPHFL